LLHIHSTLTREGGGSARPGCRNDVSLAPRLAGYSIDSLAFMAGQCACCGESVEWWVRLRSHPELAICHNCLGGLNTQRDGQVQLATGKWLVTGFEPILAVADVHQATRFYGQLGFEISFHDETYAFAHRDRDLTIHITKADDGMLAGHGSLYLHCQDADRIAEEWRGAGVSVSGPDDQDYGKREGSVTDPDGNTIRFGSPLR
jgi:catechol 2,3-dioxygenase-like lactoylglutathione lyase family enzyme